MTSSIRFGDVRLEADGAVGRLVIDRPQKLNSLTMEVQRALVDAAAWFNEVDGLKVVVVGGAGGTFTAGADTEMLARIHDERVDPDDADTGRRMADAIESIEAVTIAAIEGHCIGGGVVLAAACDLRVAAADTYFSIPEVDIGLPLGWGGVPRLVRELGPALAMELITTCRPFTAEEALQAGFLNRVAEPGKVPAVVADLVSVLVAKPAYPLRTVKRTVREAADEVAAAQGRESDATLMVAAADDDEATAAARGYLRRFLGGRGNGG